MPYGHSGLANVTPPTKDKKHSCILVGKSDFQFHLNGEFRISQFTWWEDWLQMWWNIFTSMTEVFKLNTKQKKYNSNETKEGIGLLNNNSVSSISSSSSMLGPPIKECANCGKRITERFLLKALDLFWHEDCLKCGCCDCRLGEVGSTLYTKANLILCKRDYLRLFGSTGYCSACNKVIPAFEMVMRAKNNVYHLECFACQQCNHRFCVGDRFYLCENKILCEYDYEERLVFANMTYNSTSLAHIRSHQLRQETV